MRCWLICMVLLGSPLLAQAESGSVRGRVVGPDGQAIAGAAIRIAGTAWQAITQKRGDFYLPGLAPGSYRVEVSATGYRPRAIEEVQVTSGVETEILIQLVAVTAPQSVQVDVVGRSAESVQLIPGSTHVISAEELRRTHPTDLNEVLRRAPGLFVREDSGPVSMRLNLGVRGLDPTRTRQILVLEDGIPVALSPYGEPELYYTPPIDRLERIEILKGSGSILFGPQTVGGVINFVTPDPPLSPEGFVELSGGQRGFFVGKLGYGGTRGGTGAYVGLLRKQGDGFRDFFFDINDLTAKLVFSANDRNRVGVKLNYYDEVSNSTYLGLTQPLFEDNPNTNPVPHDRLWVRRYSGSVTHQIYLGGETMLTTILYAYTTSRNWQRQDFDRRDLGRSYTGVVGDPARPGGAIFLRDSTGNRNRAFDVVGLEPRLQTTHHLFGLKNRLESGLRFHFERAFEKRLDGERFNSRTGNLQEDEIRTGRALAGFAQNRFFLTERLTLTPGVRFERFNFDRDILRRRVNGAPTDVDIRAHSRVVEVIPGLGLAYDLGSKLTLFSGLHRGFAPPRIKDAISNEGQDVQLDAEFSWNYEAGTRFQPRDWFFGEFTFFFMDFENQIIPASEAGGAVSTLTNAGETLHRGAETSLGVDLGQLGGWPASLVTEVRHTYLPTARFASGIYNGNRLPYAPRNLLTVLFRYQRPRGVNLQLDGTFVGEHFTDRQNTVAGSLDGTVGLLPAYRVWNLTASYRFTHTNLVPFVTIRNLTDELYIASRAPEGIQPAPFRQVNFGIRFGF